MTKCSVEIVFAVREMGGEILSASWDEGAAKDHSRELNAATFPGRYQVERCHVIAGRMI